MSDGWPRFSVSGREMEWSMDIPVSSTSFDHISSTTDIMPTVQDLKRCHVEGDDEPPAKRSNPVTLASGVLWNLSNVQASTAAGLAVGKSPVSILNELGMNVVYNVKKQSGPAHCPNFTVSCSVANLTFEGWGRSKREARTAAARQCLFALQSRAAATYQQVAPQSPQYIQKDVKTATQQTSQKQTSPRPSPQPEPTSSHQDKVDLFAPPNIGKSAINTLYEKQPGIVFNCTYGDGTSLTAPQGAASPLLGHSQRFKVECLINGKRYEGYGSSKKSAKLAAARAAIAATCGSDVHSDMEGCRVDAEHAAPQTLADVVGKLVTEKFQELMRSNPLYAKRKVLAGVVLTDEKRPNYSKVLCVTTGTKCISGEHLSVSGLAINDCHAEVVARRCLQRWLYDNLYMYTQAKDPREPLDASDLEPAAGGGYRLRPSRRLHLYVSTAPCGDGRIFSPHEQRAPDQHPNRQARGQLRTKIESGEGTIPVNKSQNELQTWDGVMQGERLLTMSCSDKLARWNVVGLQGALLSSFIEPLYYHSVVLGSLLHPDHLYRALCGRIEGTLELLAPPFRLQRALMARAASTEVRTAAKAPTFSVSWCADRPSVEVVNATTGKVEGSGAPSRLCKQSMFARWRYVAARLPLLKHNDSLELENMLYEEAKQLSPAYQEAKRCLVSAFIKANLGRWVKKPLEQDQFVCLSPSTSDIFT